MSKMQILTLNPEQALTHWGEVEPLVQAALEYDTYNTITLEQVRDQLGRGYAQMLIATDGEEILSVSVIQLFRSAMGERVCHVLASAGERSSEWLVALRDELVDIARHEDCTSITMNGRPGWAKKLTKLGFHTAQVQMRYRVDEQREEREQLQEQRALNE